MKPSCHYQLFVNCKLSAVYHETYTGISYPVWKIRMYRHHTTFNNPDYRSETALADYIWDLQCPDKCYLRGEDDCEHSIDYEITWKILARAPGYNPITGMCRLCLKESFLILQCVSRHWASGELLL